MRKPPKRPNLSRIILTQWWQNVRVDSWDQYQLLLKKILMTPMTCCSLLQIRSQLWIQIRIQLSGRRIQWSRFWPGSSSKSSRSERLFFYRIICLLWSVLRIRDIYRCYRWSLYSVPDPGSKGTGSWIRNKEFQIFTILLEIWSGMFLPDPESQIGVFPIPDSVYLGRQG